MNNAVVKGIALAAQAASQSSWSSKHGAIVLKNNKVVGVGFNSNRTNWLQRIYAKRMGFPKKVNEHAEFSAMRTVEFADTLIVVRLVGDEFKNSKPCPICSLMIKESGLKHLYFSNARGGISYERVK